MEVLAAVDDHGLAGDEVGGRRAQEDDGADDVLGNLVALDRAGRDRDVAQLLDHLGVRLDPADEEKPKLQRATVFLEAPVES